MNFVWAVFRRELRSYFVSPLAYTAIATFLMLQGILFFFALNQYERMRISAATRLVNVPGAEQIVRDFLGNDVMWSQVLIVPLLTMRLLAEERRQHTAELLLTAPMTTRQLVLGKFLGAWLILVLMLGLSAWMPILVRAWGEADPAPVYTGLLGALLYGSFLLGLGILASSLTESTFQAAILAMTLLAAVNIAGVAVTSLPYIGQSLEQFSPMSNLVSLARGSIDSQAVVYFVTLTWFSLDLTARVVDSQRWR